MVGRSMVKRFELVSDFTPRGDQPRALEELQARLKGHGCEVTDVVDHEVMRSIYFTDNNGIALEASWWVEDATGRPADYSDPDLFADADPVPAVRELAQSGALASTPTTHLIHEMQQNADPP